MIAVSSHLYAPLAEHYLTGIIDWQKHATVILDIPTGYALEQLDAKTTSERRSTIVITPATHPAYHDILASYYIRQVVPADNEAALGIMRAIIKDDAFSPTYQSKTGLTFTQARVLRLILRGASSKEAAARLGLAVSSINAHVANVFSLLGVHGTTARAELIRQLLVGKPAAPTAETPA